jgi:hypothetical protein
MSDIKCHVSECHYNRDVMCSAPMIQVDHCGAGKSKESEDTQCDTFKPKGH